MRFLKKFSACLLLLSLVFLAGSACAAVPQSRLRVVLILDGILGDKGFNDLMYEGVKRAFREFNVVADVLQNPDPKEWDGLFIRAIKGRYDLIISAAPRIGEIIRARVAELPDVKFGFIEEKIDAPNVVSVVFAANEGSFLMGAAAALFSKTKTIGWVGGVDIAPVRDFLTGYVQGAAFADSSVKVLTAFTGTFNDREKGKAAALEQFKNSADVVMQVAGFTGLGVFDAAKETGGFVIGVDSDQSNLLPGKVLTSQLKRVDVASYQIIADLAQGKFRGGETITMDLASGGVSIADIKLDRAINAEIWAIRDDIIAKKIKVND